MACCLRGRCLCCCLLYLAYLDHLEKVSVAQHLCFPLQPGASFFCVLELFLHAFFSSFKRFCSCFKCWMCGKSWLTAIPVVPEEDAPLAEAVAAGSPATIVGA